MQNVVAQLKEDRCYHYRRNRPHGTAGKRLSGSCNQSGKVFQAYAEIIHWMIEHLVKEKIRRRSDVGIFKITHENRGVQRKLMEEIIEHGKKEDC